MFKSFLLMICSFFHNFPGERFVLVSVLPARMYAKRMYVMRRCWWVARNRPGDPHVFYAVPIFVVKTTLKLCAWMWNGRIDY